MVAAEMHGRIMQSGIYDASEKIYVSVIGSDETSIAEVCDYIFHRYPKYIVHMTGTDFTAFEWPALRKMKEVCGARECDVWYIHTKGASNCRPDVPAYIQKNLRDWRGVMSHDVLGLHQECKSLLKKYDVAGSFTWLDYGWGPHLPGNFWWATSAHISELPYPKSADPNNRGAAELWVGARPGVKIFGIQKQPSLCCYDFKHDRYPDGVFKGIEGAS